MWRGAEAADRGSLGLCMVLGMAPNVAALALFASFRTEVSVSPFFAVETAFGAVSGDVLLVSMAMVWPCGLEVADPVVASWGPASVACEGTARSSRKSVIDCEIIVGGTNISLSSDVLELVGAAMRQLMPIKGCRSDSPVRWVSCVSMPSAVGGASGGPPPGCWVGTSPVARG
jgi:hypothetical protein